MDGHVFAVFMVFAVFITIGRIIYIDSYIDSHWTRGLLWGLELIKWIIIQIIHCFKELYKIIFK